MATGAFWRALHSLSTTVTSTHVSLDSQTAMARRANLSTSRHNNEQGQENLQPTRQRHGRVNLVSQSPSPAASFSSDKENQQVQADDTLPNMDRAKNMPPPRITTLNSANYDLPRSSRKRKLGEHSVPNASQTAHERELAEVGDLRFYDPDQSMDERRAVRKDFRDLSRELTGTRHVNRVQKKKH